MKTNAVVCAVLAAAVVFGAAGFVAGSRFANEHRNAQNHELSANRAHFDAVLLQMAQDGKGAEVFSLLERSLDSRLISVVHDGDVSRFSPSGRADFRNAALYRTRHPSSEADAERRSQLDAAVLRAQ